MSDSVGLIVFNSIGEIKVDDEIFWKFGEKEDMEIAAVDWDLLFPSPPANQVWDTCLQKTM